MDEIPTILACDVGNTNIRFARVAGDDVQDVRAMRIGDLAALGDALAELWNDMPTPRKVVASSVNPTALKALEAAASETLRAKTFVVGRDLPPPIQTVLPHPENVGADRLCCAVAAFDRLGVACVVADFGTAITIDAVSDQGVFLGGAILPGLTMGAERLAAGTALLPKVELTQPDWIFGADTHQAIVGGLIYGVRGALRYFVEAYATEMGHWPLVIATGGDAELVCGDPIDSELVQAIVPDLSLRGTAMGYYRAMLK